MIATHRAPEIRDIEVQPALDLGVEHVRRDVAIDIDQLAFARESPASRSVSASTLGSSGSVAAARSACI